MGCIPAGVLSGMAGLHFRRSIVLSARAVTHRFTGSQVYLRRAAARGNTRRICGGLQRAELQGMCATDHFMQNDQQKEMQRVEEVEKILHFPLSPGAVVGCHRKE